jgi:hypothetical protein
MLSSWAGENFNTISSGGRQCPRLNKEAEEIAIAHCTQCLHHLQVAVGATRRGNRSHLLLQNLCSRRHPPLSSSDRPPQLATRRELLVQAGSLHQVSRLHLLGCLNAQFCRFFARPLQLKSRAQYPYQQQRRPLRRSIRPTKQLLNHSQDIYSTWRHTFRCICVHSSTTPTYICWRRWHACRRARL